MSEAQAGFRKGYSTTDQIFTLKCIVELFLCQGRRLFCTFVDYSKAFDSINRATLWKKLISCGISGKVLRVILNMYKSIKSCVMANGMQSEFFESHVGLRQGENLSPLLFALFLNDMDTFFTEQKWNTLKFIDKLYTDSHDEVTGMLNLLLIMITACVNHLRLYEDLKCKHDLPVHDGKKMARRTMNDVVMSPMISPRSSSPGSSEFIRLPFSV